MIQAKRDWHNFFLGQSYVLSDYFARYILSERQWSLEENLKELPCKLPSYAHVQIIRTCLQPSHLKKFSIT